MKNRSLHQVFAIALQRVAKNQKAIVLHQRLMAQVDECRDLHDLESVYVSAGNMGNFSAGKEQLHKAHKVLKEHEAHNVEVIPFCDSIYPHSLRLIDNPPSLFYLRGNPSILAACPGVAVVGAREVTTVGKTITGRIVSMLCEHGFVIVSGLAMGVDAAAHKSTLASGGKTIAVLANGLDQAQPKQNEALGLEILESGGAWISEYPIGTKPYRHFFVQRNRIQVGLSAGSIIVEARIKSGSMTQAEFCSKANRPLFAVVPHETDNPLNLLCEGTDYMVREIGAYPLRTKDDYGFLVETMTESKNLITHPEDTLF